MSPLWLVVLVVLLFAALPVYPYSAAWGYWPSSAVLILLVIVILVLLTGRR